MAELNDSALARQLQEQYDDELNSAAIQALDEPWEDGEEISSNDNNYGDSSTMSLVDPRWEMIDPIPDIRSLFIEFNDKYFWGRLAGIEVRWSPRMTLCAGLCVYEGQGGLCSVRISEPLLKLRPRKDLIETLLHEMIHAYLFVTANNKDHDGHGPEFHKHMYRLNGETGTNISVYHTFHDEVDNCRKHWWLCDGPCKDRPPYFGYVKRAMNRAPAPRDPWWPAHATSCGGTYTKVKEPEGYGQKKKSSKDEKKSDKLKGLVDIRNFTDGKKGSSSSTVTKNEANTKPAKPSAIIVNGVLKSVKTDSGSEGKVEKPSGFDTNSGKLNGATTGGVSSHDKDEDDRKHWWLCDGSCREHAPYFGYIKRHIDQTPSAKDLWWSTHVSKCGGTYTKVRGPEISSRSSLFDSGVKKTIQGFGAMHNNETETKTIKSREGGPNIHGFGKLHPGEKSSSTQSSVAFSGNAKSLSGASGGKGLEVSETSGAIVRRIPGIGMITSERFSQGDNPGPSRLDGTPKIDKFLERMDPKPKCVIDYKSDESEFDELLDSILKPNFKKKSKRKSSVGSDKRIPGFTSVSNKRHSDPRKQYDRGEGDLPRAERTTNSDSFLNTGTSKSERVTSPDWKKTTRPIISPVRNSVISGINKSSKNDKSQTTSSSASVTNGNHAQSTSGNPLRNSVDKPAKRKVTVDNFATNRNKRALDVTSSESDSDLDENMTLGSVIKTKLTKRSDSPMKRQKYSEDQINNEPSHLGNVENFGGPENFYGAEDFGVAPVDIMETVPPVIMINCPVCRVAVKDIYINEHLDNCLLPANF